jgi:hypothetical protein
MYLVFEAIGKLERKFSLVTDILEWTDCEFGGKACYIIGCARALPPNVLNLPPLLATSRNSVLVRPCLHPTITEIQLVQNLVARKGQAVQVNLRLEMACVVCDELVATRRVQEESRCFFIFL